MSSTSALSTCSSPSPSPSPSPSKPPHSPLDDYYPTPIEDIRDKEYPHLKDEVYLDHAGMTIYSKSLLENTNKVLLSSIYGNPHSQSFSSQNSTRLIISTRLQVLDLFKADPLEYDVAFTLNSTHSIKILSTLFQDHFKSFNYAYNLNSHTSLIGVRNICENYQTFETPSDIIQATTNSDPLLIAWPGQSNFNGERFPINEWNSIFKSKFENSYTLLDAASLSTTSPPNLSDSKTSPDFTVISFYKMFGLPDLGGLIFKKSTASKIFKNKKYFGGGTVDSLSLDSDFFAFKEQLTSIIEDGTVPIHSIIQLSQAIETNSEIYGSFDNISSYTSNLTRYTIERLSNLKYKNGTSMVELYTSGIGGGPIISFSLKNINDEFIGYHSFEKYTSLQNISLRTGTLCNIGGIKRYLNRQDFEIKRDYKKGHKCGDFMDIMEGKPTGVIRISFGAMTLYSEIEFLIEKIKDFLIDDLQITSTSNQDIKIEKLVVYPIKSCQGFDVPLNESWKVTNDGLEFDRLFVIVNLLDGKPLNLKNYKKMCYLKPIISKDKRKITIVDTFNDNNSITIDVNFANLDLHVISSHKYMAVFDSFSINFFKKLLGIPCTIATSAIIGENLQAKSSFLLINSDSFNSIGDELDKSQIRRFRSNIIISGAKPFIEDDWNGVKIGATHNPIILNKIDNCDRCHMITITEDGKVDPNLFMKLSKFRKFNGKVYFGINLNVEQLGQGYLSVGDKITVV
ncbi:hypothetical protein CANARDRAFT_175628 [[Candida] arabinofermentans NRRL YB-2248]|uniref:MOSC domain-containing protein n=1 Tax=[Candida] arabinofermentans NRRL YB-2248 TaxID=983967 RepID=A0A1E4T284_9ASCO|nr:hypothetical protein CANARDRAFT_175628 [[Candida] arabinofermentans NRRL YB-2248]